MGRPPIEFKAEYCAMFIAHSKQGNSFESFGAVIDVSRDTLYRWLKSHPEFCDARIRGLDHLEKFYEDLGKRIAAGQLYRVKSERPVLHNGKPVMDPSNGQVLTEKEYEQVQGNATALIWLSRNMLGWRNDVDLNLHLPGDNPKEKRDDLTPKERLREIAEAMRLVQDLQEEEDVIDVSPAKQA